MFRLPFAAGRVFSISMLDTLLYQVPKHMFCSSHELTQHGSGSSILSLAGVLALALMWDAEVLHCGFK